MADALTEKSMRWDWERAFLASDLPSSTKLVGMVLATFAARDGIVPKEWTPGLKRLHELTSIKKGDALRGHIRALGASGWFEVTHPTPEDARRGTRNQYRLTYPGSPDTDDGGSAEHARKRASSSASSTPHAVRSADVRPNDRERSDERGPVTSEGALGDGFGHGFPNGFGHGFGHSDPATTRPGDPGVDTTGTQGYVPEVPRGWVPQVPQSERLSDQFRPSRSPSSSTTPRPIPDDWTPNHTHTVVARDLGLNIHEQVANFRHDMTGAQRSDWDKAFGAYLRDTDLYGEASDWYGTGAAERLDPDTHYDTWS